VLAVATVLLVVLAHQNRELRERIAEWRGRATFPHVGMVVPAFRATTLAGDSVTIGETKPGGHQVLFVLNTTCGFCLETLPAWKTVFTELNALGRPENAVYGISLDSEDETRRYVLDHGLAFPILCFPDPRLAKLYRAEGVPLTVVLDHNGEMVHVRMGALRDRGSIDSVIAAVRQAAVPARTATQ
jgi:peroxiredoxin